MFIRKILLVIIVFVFSGCSQTNTDIENASIDPLDISYRVELNRDKPGSSESDPDFYDGKLYNTINGTETLALESIVNGTVELPENEVLFVFSKTDSGKIVFNSGIPGTELKETKLFAFREDMKQIRPLSETVPLEGMLKNPAKTKVLFLKDNSLFIYNLEEVRLDSILSINEEEYFTNPVKKENGKSIIAPMKWITNSIIEYSTFDKNGNLLPATYLPL